ncbi:uncharacterized protein [Atheta coriaria]|uniref:uncharacterized protein n=1 Tax=Dalotia coriaria TaxID=877792 RepID=UPI0031F4562A
MVLDQYCQIVQRDTASISVLWKALHVLCLLTATICSLITALNIMRIIEVFGFNCILYANLKFTDVNAYESAGPIPENFSFHNPLTIWGSDSVCSYTRGTYLFSMIVAMIMLAFVIVFPKGGYAKNRTVDVEGWKLVPWAIVFSSVMVVCIGIAHAYIKNGLSHFTDQIYAKLKEESDCDSMSYIPTMDPCHADINTFTLIFQPSIVWISRYIVSLKVTATIVFVAWIVLIGTLILRIIVGVDFRIVVYNLKPVVKDVDTGSSVSEDSFSDDDNRIQPNKKLVAGQIHTDNTYKVSDASDTVETFI